VQARTKSALLWGIVAVLTVLVVAMGYRLVVGPLELGPAVTAAVALGAGLVVTASAYVTEHRLAGNGQP
jgi:hypothetical protein